MNTKNNLAGKELAIGISIGFVLMAFLMIFADNLEVNIEGNQIHAISNINLE